ncbi:MAG: hypothetical protein JJU34_18545 [Lunatimonas sp.]|uniref:hypothetical protein n=1 Tax=Lunatimonas sp. TaxID=2060141 RepID=UPI00263B3B6C|nr:hypothetical protein [Lunatimonas sp.]MCC5939285.1 hypothetical protein [Lunatimonas sp.]
MKKLSLVFFLLFTVPLYIIPAIAVDFASEFDGSWTYECYDAPYPYHEGAVLIVSKEKETLVTITLKNGQSVSGKNVAIKDGKLSFDIYVEGSVVKTVLEQKGSQLTGKVNTPEGIMNLVIKKKDNA